MTSIVLDEFAPVISNSEQGEMILARINKSLSSDEKVILDFEKIITMATFNAKQIFGALYLAMGPESFFERLELKNANRDLQMIIRMGIESALEDNITESNR